MRAGWTDRWLFVRVAKAGVGILVILGYLILDIIRTEITAGLTLRGLGEVICIYLREVQFAQPQQGPALGQSYKESDNLRLGLCDQNRSPLVAPC